MYNAEHDWRSLTTHYDKREEWDKWLHTYSHAHDHWNFIDNVCVKWERWKFGVRGHFQNLSTQKIWEIDACLPWTGNWMVT